MPSRYFTRSPFSESKHESESETPCIRFQLFTRCTRVTGCGTTPTADLHNKSEQICTTSRSRFAQQVEADLHNKLSETMCIPASLGGCQPIYN